MTDPYLANRAVMKRVEEPKKRPLINKKVAGEGPDHFQRPLSSHC